MFHGIEGIDNAPSRLCEEGIVLIVTIAKQIAYQFSIVD